MPRGLTNKAVHLMLEIAKLLFYVKKLKLLGMSIRHEIVWSFMHNLFPNGPS